MAVRRVLCWGNYDLGKPRCRILVNALRDAGYQVEELHLNLWHAVEDKSQLQGWRARLPILFLALVGYPLLLFRLAFAPRPDAIFIGYPGYWDVLLAAPIAKLRGIPIYWDAFFSLYDTLVNDRALLAPQHMLARLVRTLERWSCFLSRRVLIDTRSHGRYVAALLGVPPELFKEIKVSAEEELFVPLPSRRQEERVQVLFYGQFIPLHGIDIILRAAAILRSENIEFRLVGKGQEYERMRKLARELELSHVVWVDWIPFVELPQAICDADIGLGIFGESDKARRVIPNKVYQMAACGKAIITGDSAAAGEFLSHNEDALLTQPGDANELAAAILLLAKSKAERERLGKNLREKFLQQASQASVARRLREILDS